MHPSCSDWDLDIYGDGWDRPALERWVLREGLADRVRFLGHRPRSEILAAFENGDAMLFPSMHDQAGWVVAEASSLGCPVVCLPLGGPPLLAEPNDFVVSLNGDVVGNTARQLVAAGESPSTPRHNRWSRNRIPDLVEQWYDAVIANGHERQVAVQPRSD
jgi:glycosyltransferase involved in cell wall biosynthesis